MRNIEEKYPIKRLICMSILVILFFPAVIILLSGNLLWIEGWILSIWFDLMMLGNIFYMYKKNPALISERLNAHGTQNQKKWDKYLLIILFLLSAFWISSMPLDSQRFGLSPRFPILIQIFGFIFLIPSYYLLLRATIDNPYLSTVVRIQSDRKQQVISTGLYGVIRHPQYLGIITLIISGPLLLGSIIGLIIGICIVVIILVRIDGEEKMLFEELEGYDEYRQRVKYRLLPLIW
jgi:protein-S-isoprenylcysteine O-methyltransferase Ste14